jgi:glucose-6-phosphate isomerase
LNALEGVVMQLPDESISYEFQGLLAPGAKEWTPLAELQACHLLAPGRLKELSPRLLQVRSQVAAERDLGQVPPEFQPLEAGFIDLPQRLLDDQRRKGMASVLGRILDQAAALREQVDRVAVLGSGGCYLGARALFEALRNTYHNELSPEARLGVPRFYFEGNTLDNDTLQDLLDLLQTSCVDPDLREERWGVIVMCKTGGALETAAVYRILRREAAEYYGSRSDRLRRLFIPVTGPTGRLRNLCKMEGFDDDAIFTLPENVGSRFAVFTPAGLVPAAVMGLDVRAILLGAAAMTKRFLEEPFEHNPALQFAAVNYLMTAECGKSIRVLSVGTKKLEALGHWYDQLLAESLGKQGAGPTPLTAVSTRDLSARGQLHQEGLRDKLINNLVLKAPRSIPIAIGMADRNEDDLNTYCRKTLPNLIEATRRSVNRAHAEVARPTADLIVPTLSEHTLGQLLQMLMLATVVEGRLMGINPYGHPGIEAYQRHRRELLKNA